MSCQFTSRHITSHHVLSCHVATSKCRNVLGSDEQRRDVNVTTLGANVATLLEIYEQRRNVGHKRRDIARFSSNRKVVKIQSLGLLLTSKLFPLHINHPRSSHDHIHKEQHWI